MGFYVLVQVLESAVYIELTGNIVHLDPLNPEFRDFCRFEHQRRLRLTDRKARPPYTRYRGSTQFFKYGHRNISLGMFHSISMAF
jgi:hypothetical protein